MGDTLQLIFIGLFIFLIVAVAVLAVVCYKLKAKCEQYKQGIAVQKVFLQNMSHDIRTPMNAICGFSQILCNSQIRSLLSEEEIAEYGVVIQSNTDMLSTLVDDILDISDMESGKYRINYAQCNANDTCRKAISTVKFRCPDSVKMYMTTDLPDDFSFRSDPKRVEQVIINYLTNAVKHTNEGEIHLHVSDKENPGMLTFSVADTGEGVPADKAEFIFGRFEKLNTIKGGTGLGLAICRNIAGQLGGEAKLDTTYGPKGARFIFTHPVEK